MRASPAGEDASLFETCQAAHVFAARPRPYGMEEIRQLHDAILLGYGPGFFSRKD